MVNTDLQRWRTRLGLSQPQMAAYVGVPLRTWQNWENGSRGAGSAACALFDLLITQEAICPQMHETRLNQALNGLGGKEDE